MYLYVVCISKPPCACPLPDHATRNVLQICSISLKKIKNKQINQQINKSRNPSINQSIKKKTWISLVFVPPCVCPIPDRAGEGAKSTPPKAIRRPEVFFWGKKYYYM